MREDNSDHDCLEFDLALADRTIIKLATGKWARVVKLPGPEKGDFSRERYSEIDRCPFCNHKL